MDRESDSVAGRTHARTHVREERRRHAKRRGGSVRAEDGLGDGLDGRQQIKERRRPERLVGGMGGRKEGGMEG